MPSALILILGRTTLWQVRRASGGLRRSRLRCSCDAAKAQRVQFELLLPCVPGALPEEADPRECFARNAERAGRLSRKVALDRMSPSAERALLPTSRGNNDERALVPTALLISPKIRRLAAQRSFAQAQAASTYQPNWRLNLQSARRGSAGPANGRVSAAAKS